MQTEERSPSSTKTTNITTSEKISCLNNNNETKDLGCFVCCLNDFCHTSCQFDKED